ncbi:uncharacterized protein RHO25_006218 [Cercospora beticola]|uniref:Uncharacterized protein n=1 Tax=Cercospora beticola TaxID=122368 RepID=A0ABZ0NPV3_CERBT|nr:hypothetical protein RHO25_006218 [Cercospora beticola]
MFPEEYSSWGTFGAIGTTASGAYHCVLAVHLDSKYSCLSGLLQAALRLERSPSYRIPGNHTRERTAADDELPPSRLEARVNLVTTFSFRALGIPAHERATADGFLLLLGWNTRLERQTTSPKSLKDLQ